jgi:O-antigen ligase
MTGHILQAAVIAALIQLIEHWFPWRMLIGRELPRVAAYALGVLGFMAPLSVLFIDQQAWGALLAVWAVVVASGMAVMSAYAADWVMDRVRRSYEHEELSHAKAE